MGTLVPSGRTVMTGAVVLGLVRQRTPSPLVPETTPVPIGVPAAVVAAWLTVAAGWSVPALGAVAVLAAAVLVVAVLVVAVLVVAELVAAVLLVSVEPVSGVLAPASLDAVSVAFPFPELSPLVAFALSPFVPFALSVVAVALPWVVALSASAVALGSAVDVCTVPLPPALLAPSVLVPLSPTAPLAPSAPLVPIPLLPLPPLSPSVATAVESVPLLLLAVSVFALPESAEFVALPVVVVLSALAESDVVAEPEEEAELPS